MENVLIPALDGKNSAMGKAEGEERRQEVVGNLGVV